ncbi:MAG: calcium/sodium antiporter [Planctomycetaceae bacterium]|nr:calcium/sodium antiporter [Planctomycetaceae bacterium]
MNSFFLLVAGLIALVIGAEALVRGASKLAGALGVSSLVIGLTVVAFGTSAPEMAVSVSSSLSGQGDIALGNVVGSNIFNLLFILGASALVVPLVVDRKLIRVDIPLMVLASLIAWIFSNGGTINRIEGSLLFISLLIYTAQCIWLGRRSSPELQQEYQEAFPTSKADPGNDPHRHSPRLLTISIQIIFVSLGLVLLVLGANWLVTGATTIARHWGISELVIGLTIVAAGTSLPEVATSLVAAFKGERDIAVGNVVGSNLFNLLGVLGLSAAVAPGGSSVSPEAIYYDIPVMIFTSLIVAIHFRVTSKIQRWHGLLLVSLYVGYTVFLILRSKELV